MLRRQLPCPSKTLEGEALFYPSLGWQQLIDEQRLRKSFGTPRERRKSRRQNFDPHPLCSKSTGLFERYPLGNPSTARVAVQKLE
jgi:hypothetical protein